MVKKSVETKTKSTTYLLPMLGRNKSEFIGASFPQNQFVNCFFADKCFPELEGKILLLYRFSGNRDYVKFEENLQSYPTFSHMYEPDKFHTMYVFDVPEKFTNEYKLFKEGKYSLFSREYKHHIKNFFGFPDPDPTGGGHSNAIMQVLYREEARYQALEKELSIKIPRSQEASSIPDPDVESYCEEFKEISVIRQPNEDFWKGVERE